MALGVWADQLGDTMTGQERLPTPYNCSAGNS